MYDRVKKAYDKRSAFIHGSEKTITQIDLNEMQATVVSILRRLIELKEEGYDNMEKVDAFIKKLKFKKLANSISKLNSYFLQYFLRNRFLQKITTALLPRLNIDLTIKLANGLAHQRREKYKCLSYFCITLGKTLIEEEMKVGPKGQVVIPRTMRKALKIDLAPKYYSN